MGGGWRYCFAHFIDKVLSFTRTRYIYCLLEVAPIQCEELAFATLSSQIGQLHCCYPIYGTLLQLFTKVRCHHGALTRGIGHNIL